MSEIIIGIKFDTTHEDLERAIQLVAEAAAMVLQRRLDTMQGASGHVELICSDPVV